MVIKQPNYPPAAYDMAKRDASQILALIVHHSDGPADQDPLAIDREHRAQGWAMIGYNYVIAGDGTIYKARPDGFVPSAAYGYNTNSVNVVLLGDFQPGTPGAQDAVPAVQLQALKDLSVKLHQIYPSIVRTIGHRDVATLFYPSDTADYATACPGDVLEALLPDVRAYTIAKVKL